jgi:hypothetical protein
MEGVRHAISPFLWRNEEAHQLVSIYGSNAYGQVPLRDEDRDAGTSEKFFPTCSLFLIGKRVLVGREYVRESGEGRPALKLEECLAIARSCATNLKRIGIRHSRHYGGAGPVRLDAGADIWTGIVALRH